MSINTKAIKLSNLAEELLKKGINTEAVEALKRSIRLSNGEDMKSYLKIAITLFNNGDYEHAKVFLNTFLEYWMAAEAYFILGSISKKECKLQEAFEHYKKGVTLYNGDDLVPYYEFLSLCNVLKEEDKGIDTAKYILKIDNRDRIALVFLANYFFANKKYKEAMKFYEVLVDNNLADYNDYHYYGVCLHELKDYKRAENMYLQALEMYPADSPETMALKNLRNRKLEDNYPNIEKSKKEYLENIKHSPKSSDYFHLGNIEFINGNYDKASEFYSKAKELYLDKVCV